MKKQTKKWRKMYIKTDAALYDFKPWKVALWSPHRENLKNLITEVNLLTRNANDSRAGAKMHEN